MLGHIAIAALGGYYAQDAESGAVIDTYVPSEFVRMTGLHQWGTTIEPQHAIFERVFDDTQLYVKAEYLMPASVVTFPRTAVLGTSNWNASLHRTWWYGGCYSGNTVKTFSLIFNENELIIKDYAPSAGAFVVWTKQGERRCNMAMEGVIVQGTVARYNSFEQQKSLMIVGSSHSYIDQNFYVASLQNAYYGVHYLVSPMASPTTAATAVFEHFNPTLQEL